MRQGEMQPGGGLARLFAQDAGPRPPRHNDAERGHDLPTRSVEHPDLVPCAEPENPGDLVRLGGFELHPPVMDALGWEVKSPMMRLPHPLAASAHKTLMKN